MLFDYQDRMQTLMASVDVDAVILVPGANMVYYTGLHFHLSERPTFAVISKDGLAMMVPGLELAKVTARDDLKAKSFAWSDDEGYMGSIKATITALELGNKKVGVDGMTMRVFEWLALAEGGINLGTAKDVSESLLLQRAHKTQPEVEAMRKAIKLSEAALRDTIEFAKPGMTELQIQEKLVDALSEHDSDAHSFSPIVLTGPNSALPHGLSGERVLGEGWNHRVYEKGGAEKGKQRVIHAECAAVADAVRNLGEERAFDLLQGATCWIVRLEDDSGYDDAPPCPQCELLLRAGGVTKVVTSTRAGALVELALSEGRADFLRIGNASRPLRWACDALGVRIARLDGECVECGR